MKKHRNGAFLCNYGFLYGKKTDQSDNDLWFWKHDVDYIDALMQHEYPGRKFFFVADDWGGGIASAYEYYVQHVIQHFLEIEKTKRQTNNNNTTNIKNFQQYKYQTWNGFKND